MEIPFIELFHTPNGSYFLDINRNDLIPIRESSFKYLLEVLSGKKELDANEPEELTELRSQGYLTFQSVVKEVQHAYLKFLRIFLQRKLAKITLQLTQNCNFRCKYCIYSENSSMLQRSHSSKHMSFEVAQKAVDFLWKHSVDSQDINVGFYGGEPLLEFPLIQKLVAYCKERFEGKKLTFSLTTNGTLLSDEMIRYFEAHDISMMISLDGPKEINDQNRVFADGRGTYDSVMEHVYRIFKIAPEYAEKLQISMVMDPENDFDCINAICLQGEELKRLNIMPSIIDREYDGTDVVFAEEYTWKYEYQRFLANLSYFGRYPEDEVSPVASRSVTAAVSDNIKINTSMGLHRIDAPSGPCVPGQARLFVDVNGRLFPCERVSENSPAMCIGTLDDGFYEENAQRILNIGHLTENACKKCWCFRYCSLCAKKADTGSRHLSAKFRLSHCNESKAMAYSKLKQYLLFKEIPVFYPAQTRLIHTEGGQAT